LRELANLFLLISRVLTHRLAALIPSIGNARCRVTLRIEELGLFDKTPERISSARGVRVSTNVDERIVVPAASLKAVGGVLGRVQVELVVSAEGRCRIDLEAMAIGGHAKDDLRSGDASIGPLGDGFITSAHGVAFVTGSRESSIGAGHV
jgi:hypothetical protein